eukprot:scaffold26622_cov147-Skeletonema_menzelii.AAC.15
MSRTSFDAYFDAYGEGKDYSAWDEKSGGFAYLSPVSSSESDAPPPPPTDESDASFSSFAEQHVSSSFDSNDGIGDSSSNRQLGDIVCETRGYEEDESRSRASTNDGHLDIGALAFLEGHEKEFIHDYEKPVEKKTSDDNLESLIAPMGNNLESFVEILNHFTLRCAFDHLKCMAMKETEKCKQVQRHQACLQMLSIIKRAQVRRVFLLFNRIVWQESVVGAIKQRKVNSAFRSWRDIAAATSRRRKVYFLGMMFNRWWILTEESVSMRQKQYAALMHWAERLTRQSFVALKSHANAQREERVHVRGRYCQSQAFRNSFRSPEHSLVWSNSTPDYTKANKSRVFDQGRRYLGSSFVSSGESFAVGNSLRLRTPFQSITPSARDRFQELRSSRKASYSSYQLSDELQSSRRTSLSQADSSFAVPFGCAADDIV